MSRDKQIEEKSCEECIHYEVCRFVNALAVANVVNAENCRMFKDTKGYRKYTDVAREIFEEIVNKIAENDDIFERCASRLVSSDYANGRSEVVGEILHFLGALKKKYESEGADDETDT